MVLIGRQLGERLESISWPRLLFMSRQTRVANWKLSLLLNSTGGGAHILEVTNIIGFNPKNSSRIRLEFA